MNSYRYRPKPISFLIPLFGLVVTLATPFFSQRRRPVEVEEDVQGKLTQDEAERIADRAVAKAGTAKKYVAEVEQIRKPSGGGLGRFIAPTIFILGVRWLLTAPRRERQIPLGAQTKPSEEITQPQSETRGHRTVQTTQTQARPAERQGQIQSRSESFDYPGARRETRQTEAERQPEGQHDDLKVIEGIGPAIARKLNNRGIHTFTALAETDQQTLEDILAEEGIRQLSDPHTWPEQARLAANGQWDELRDLQKRLKAGRETR